jgi:Tol biopolymer transport system component
MSVTRTKSPRGKAGRNGSTKTRNTVIQGVTRSRGNGHAPRQLVVVTVFAFILAVGLLSWDLSESWRTGPPSVAGQIAIPASGGVSLADPATGRITPLIPAAQNASVTAMAWSPDRQMLAYTLFHRRPEDRVSSAELFTVPVKGGESTLVVPRPQPGSVIDAPAWSPDGQSLYYAFQGVESGKPVARIERVELSTGARHQLFNDGSFPTVSNDGKFVAFSHDEDSGQALRIGSVAGGDSRELVKASAFRGLMGPRFSPDGSWIAFVAVGPGPSGAIDERRSWLADLFTARVAYAHGDPWGVWKIRPDGSELQRATTLQEDEPLISWSPDGAWLAVHGTGGLWVVDARGVGEPRRVMDGTIGGIDW